MDIARAETPADPDRRVSGLARTGIAVAVATLIVLGKVTGLARDLLTGTTFGVSAVTDAYFFASAVTASVYIGIFGAIPLVLVPSFAGASEGSVSQRPRSIVGVLFVCAIGLTLLLGLTSALDITISSGLSTEARGPLRVDLVLMASTFALSAYVAVANAVQVWRGRTMWSYAAPVVNNVIFCAAVVIAGTTFGLTPALVASIIGWALLAVVNYRALGRDAALSLPVVPTGAEIKSALALVAPLAATVYIEQSYSFIATYAASHLPGHAVTQWALATRLAFVAVSVYGVLISTSVFPQMARLAASGDIPKLQEIALRTCRRILLVCTPIVVAGYLYAPDAVGLLVQRGRISAEESLTIARVTGLLLLGLPLSLFRDVFSRGSIAVGRASGVFQLSVASAILLGILAFLATSWGGLQGLALVFIGTQFAQAAAFGWMFQHHSGVGLGRPVLSLVVRATGSAAMVLLLRAALRMVDLAPWPLEAAFCIGAFGVLAALSRDPDVRTVMATGGHLIDRLLGRPTPL